jgi:hypothetical protein
LRECGSTSFEVWCFAILQSTASAQGLVLVVFQAAFQSAYGFVNSLDCLDAMPAEVVGGAGLGAGIGFAAAAGKTNVNTRIAAGNRLAIVLEIFMGNISS